VITNASVWINVNPAQTQKAIERLRGISGAYGHEGLVAICGELTLVP
jgi:hypothetical protein